jgi:phosphatidylcholine synthase
LISAWLVHLYTASGAVLALLALLRIDQGEFRDAFWLMSLAVFIDSTDGTLARWSRVKEAIPWFDGDRLEDIVDYLNYVVVPVWFMLRAGLLPAADALWLAALCLLASAYGFCQREAKTQDHFFLGFPSYWNIVAFYLFALRTPPWLNAFAVVILSALVFLPIRYLYPSRTPVLRGPTVALGGIWGAMMLVAIYRMPNPPPLLVGASLFFPAYYAILSLWLEVQRWKKRRD